MTRGKKIVISFFTLILLLLAIFYLIVALYYKNHFQPGSFINNIDYSGKTVEQVEADISKEISSYTLEIEGKNGVTETITADEISYRYVSDGQIAALKESQNPFTWPISFFTKEYREMNATCTYDNKKLLALIDNLLFFQKDVVSPPIDAAIMLGENGYFIQKEDEGSTLDKDKVILLLKDKISTSEESISLIDENCYINPKVYANQANIKKALKKLKAYTNLTVTYDFGDRSEVLDQKILREWVTLDENFKVELNEQHIIDYVNFLGYYYTTFASTRDFKRFDGKVIQVRGGDYGWIINRKAEVEELKEIILAGKSVTREPVYSQTAKSRNQNDIGGTYIEINLKKQKVWFFKDNKKILSASVVTGNELYNYDTPSGIYQITYKERNAVLNGENYSSPVSYWMPFNKNIGLHDASWRKAFGKDIYKTNGSHGCINMPPKKAQLLYENIEKGTPVVVY